MKRSIELLRFKTDRGSVNMATVDMILSVACSSNWQDLKLKQCSASLRGQHFVMKR